MRVAEWLVTAAVVASWTTRHGQGRTTHCTVPCSGLCASPKRGTRMNPTLLSSCRYSHSAKIQYLRTQCSMHLCPSIPFSSSLFLPPSSLLHPPLFPSFPPSPFLSSFLQEPDLCYLVENIWGGQSALSAVQELFELVLVRWDRREQWSPWNCILLTKDEAKAHCRLDNVQEVCVIMCVWGWECVWGRKRMQGTIIKKLTLNLHPS